MRKIIVLSFITLDGIMQAPGGPKEDISGGFKYGGWAVPYFDDFAGKVMSEQMGHPFDLLLGRKTYDIFVNYWPDHNDPKDPVGSGINKATKFVASRSLFKSDWAGTVMLQGDVAEAIKKLKQQYGPELQVHGSGNLIQTLLKQDLVDELLAQNLPNNARLWEAAICRRNSIVCIYAHRVQNLPEGSDYRILQASWKGRNRIVLNEFKVANLQS